MKKKIFAIVMAVCLIAGTNVFAQGVTKNEAAKERPTVEQMAQRRTERMVKELNLNETQTKQVYSMNLESAKAMESQRTQMKASRSASAEQMKKILTTEQFMKWSQMQGNNKYYKGGHKGMMSKECRKQGVKECGEAKKPCCKSNSDAKR